MSLADELSEHFPTGLRSKQYVIATTNELVEGPIQCECWCGESFVGADEQEARQLWAEHVTALRTPETPGAITALSASAAEIARLEAENERLRGRPITYERGFGPGDGDSRVITEDQPDGAE